MSQTATPTTPGMRVPGRAAPSRRPADTAHTQRLAWGVILIAFGLFCALCLVTGLGVNDFLFYSTTRLPYRVAVGRGTVGLTGVDGVERAERRASQQTTSAALRTDTQSQASISVLDTYDANHLVASITLDANSAVSVRSVVRPRFDWSSLPYEVSLDGLTGSIAVFIPPGLPRAINLTAVLADGVQVRLTAPGQYRLRVSDADVQLENDEGTAAIYTPAGRSYGIPPGQQGVFNRAQPQIIINTAPVNLLANSTFSQINSAPDSSGQVSQLPLAWRCTDAPNDIPSGQYGLVQTDARNAMRLFRGEGANSHGETECAQYFGTPESGGRDVRGYTTLRVRTVFQIISQSLALCGQYGSECPFMLRMDYRDAQGEPLIWYHGFYWDVSGQPGWPSRCPSCVQDHEDVNANAWYTYESENLLTLFAEGERPASIQSVRFYASGHQYNVQVGEVSLLAGYGEAFAPSDAVGG